MQQTATAFNTPQTPFIFSCKCIAVLILQLLLLELSLISCRRRRRQCVAVYEQSRYHLHRSCFCRSGDPFELATPTPTPTSKPKPTSMSAIDLIVADIAHISDSSALPGTSTTTYRVRIVMAWQSCCLHLHLAVRSSTHDMQL